MYLQHYFTFFRKITFLLCFEVNLMPLLMNDAAMQRSIKRIAHEIIEQHQKIDQMMLLGIQTRGVFLAQRIAKELFAIDGVLVPVVAIDVKPFRDDLTDKPVIPLPTASTKDKQVILIDDVLFTGRTLRAAMDAVIAMGRPTRIQCAVLIDRGHRELPVTANFIGKNIATKRTERVFVKFVEQDGVDCVELD
jgi:pyrimidine operon attenuation protein / uracil phosphoribosyltransferase